MRIANSPLPTLIATACLALSAPHFLLAADKPKFETESLRGKVVFLAEVLEEKHDIKSVPEAHDRTLALETPEGKLIPLVEDTRGRAFRVDKRLREMPVELLVRRYAGVPAVQIIRIHEVTKEGLFEVDYWCDICSIAMYELKQCDCCQGPIELRRRKVNGK